MVDLSENLGWVPIPRTETADVLLGGDELNAPNFALVRAASRDKWLRDELEARTGNDAAAIESFNNFRDIGQASIAQGRLTLDSGNPLPGSDLSGEGTLYYTPFEGDLVSLWNSAESRWDITEFTERSLSLSGLAANANYDIFLYDNLGALTLQPVIWANNGAGTSSRASAIVRRNGVWVKSADNRRYLGTIRTRNISGQCDDNQRNRFVWNAANRRPRAVYLVDNVSHAYTAGYRAYRASTANRFQAVFGLDDTQVILDAFGSGGFNADCNVNIGVDAIVQSGISIAASSDFLDDNIAITAYLSTSLAAGHHWFQLCQTTTALGSTPANSAQGTYTRGGIIGTIMA